MADEDLEPLPPGPQFPIACPHCTMPSGYPYRVETMREKQNRVNVAVRCKLCEHTWIVERLGLKPPPQ